MYSDVVPCVGSLGFLVILLGFFVVMRYLNYRERLALAEKGLVRPEPARGNGKDTLRWGIAIAAVGLALCIGLYPVGYASDAARLGSGSSGTYPLHFGPWMLVGLLPTFFGIGLILIYVLTREEKPKDEPAKTDKEGELPRS
jgi:hypothetical protein